MKKKLASILTASLIGFSIGLYGQDKVVIGRIVDNETKSPVKDVHVHRDTATTKSNHLGFFQLNAASGDTLVINHDEYQNATIIVPAEDRFVIPLEKKKLKTSIVYLASEVDVVPEPVGGMYDFFQRWSKYILKTGTNRVGDGTVYLYAIVDETGKVIDSGIEKSIGDKRDKVVLDAFKKADSGWAPGVKNGENVKVKMILPFGFRINRD
jgi:Gram-negative bacterial TonB protein C-terminal